MVRCACRSVTDIAALQALSGLTPKEQGITLNDIDPAAGSGTHAMLLAARAFAAQPVGMLTLSGTPGNAKSVALMGIVNALVARGVPAVYVSMFDLLGHIKQAFANTKQVVDDDAYSRLQRFARVRVLVIDEFDKVKLSEWALEQITDLVDRRYRNMDTLGTVVAMNDDIHNLPAWIASRLRDGRNRVVRNTDPDLRPLMEV